MAFQLSKVSQAVQMNGIKVLVYGGPGCGKTVLAATLGPGTVIISAEAGLLSLKRRNLETLFGMGNPWIEYDPTIIQISNIQQMLEVYTWLQQSHEAKAYHTVAMDSLSEIAEQILNNAKKRVKDPRQAYGVLLEQVENMVRAYRDLPGRNVYISAKMEPTKDELTGIVKYMPAMPGAKLGPKLPYFFDEVFRLGINKTPTGETYRFLQTQPDMQYEAKDRSGALAPLEEPHLGKIFAKIMQGS